MEQERSDWEAYAIACARALRLPLEEAWKPATVANLETIFRIAAAVDSFPLPDEMEPAPVFEA